jgi:hypothetical protein
MPPPWLQGLLHKESPPVNQPTPIKGPTPIWHGPVTLPVPKGFVNEILREVKEAEKHGEIPIAVGPGGVIAIPKSLVTEVKPPTEHGKPSLKPTPQGEKQSSLEHSWVGWRIEPEMGEYIKGLIKAFEHRKHIERPPIMLPMMGGVLAPIPGAPAPGAPVAILPPQGAGNQQGVAVGLP